MNSKELSNIPTLRRAENALSMLGDLIQPSKAMDIHQACAEADKLRSNKTFRKYRKLCMAMRLLDDITHENSIISTDTAYRALRTIRDEFGEMEIPEPVREQMPDYVS